MSGTKPISVSNQPPLILLADDDKLIRVLLREFLEKEGYRVMEVTNGKECLETFLTVKPDLVMLDGIMPVMDGFACCKQLIQIARNNLATALANFDSGGSSLGATVISKLWERTPILMITGLENPELVDRAFEVGASDFITKPIHMGILRQRVRRLLQQAQLYKQLEAANKALQHLAHVDGLTGVANRRRFNNYLNSQWLNLVPERSPLSLILCDIDFFKLYNDKYGHPAGDICLQKVGTVLSETVHNSQDLVARYGGEEFAVIMPNTNMGGAVHFAAAMQARVRELEILHEPSTISSYVTLSLGVATTIPTFESEPSSLILEADKALYKAKAEGRNRIILKQMLD
jgi:diguanylate cyclase (GGDEF)-like protein